MTFSSNLLSFTPQCYKKLHSYKLKKQNLHSTNSLNNWNTKHHQPTHNMTGIIKFGGKIATQLKK